MCDADIPFSANPNSVCKLKAACKGGFFQYAMFIKQQEDL